MDPNIAIRLFLLVLGVVLSASFAGSETALFSLRPLTLKRLRKENHPQAALLQRLTARPRQLLSSLVIGNEVSDVTASVAASSLFIAAYGPSGKYLAIALMVPLMMLAGEVVPKVVAALNPVRFASRAARPVALWLVVISPVRWVAERLLALLPAEAEGHGRILEDEFLKWVRSSHKEGLVQEVEREFIENLIAFEATTLAEVMTPRLDIFALSVGTPLAEAVARLRRRHFSRVPVWEGEEDNIVGVLFAKDLLAQDVSIKDISVKGISEPEALRPLRPAYFAPETKKAEAMLWEMQRRRLHMVLVVDEYGGLAGLVTLDDLLEELFGEMYDEHELTERPLRERQPGVWAVSPRLSVEEFNERMETKLPEGEGFETMGGFILHAFGRMPTQGEEVVWDALRFRTARLKGTRILEIELRREEPGQEASGQEKSDQGGPQ